MTRLRMNLLKQITKKKNEFVMLIYVYNKCYTNAQPYTVFIFFYITLF
jgi:hypothetical protein